MKAFPPVVTSLATTVGFLSGGLLSVSIQSGALHMASPWHLVFGHHASLIFTILSAVSSVAILIAGWGRSPGDHKKPVNSILPKDERPRNTVITSNITVPAPIVHVPQGGFPPIPLENKPVVHILISSFFKSPKF